MRPTRIVVALVMPLLALAAPALGQDASPPSATELEIRMPRERAVVQPPAPPTVQQDATRAQEELAAEARRERLIREITRPTRGRPDLDSDVLRAIQGRQLQRARR